MFLENLEISPIYEKICEQKDYHEDMQKLLLFPNQTANFFLGLTSLISESFKIYHFRNVFVTSDFPAILNETDVILPWRSRIKIPKFTFKTNSRIYENVVFPNSIYGAAFGHYMNVPIFLIFFRR